MGSTESTGMEILVRGNPLGEKREMKCACGTEFTFHTVNLLRTCDILHNFDHIVTGTNELPVTPQYYIKCPVCSIVKSVSIN